MIDYEETLEILDKNDISLIVILKGRVSNWCKVFRLKPKIGEVVLVFGHESNEGIIQPAIITRVYSHNLVDLTIFCNRNWPSSVAKMTRAKNDGSRYRGWNYKSWYKRCLYL